MKKALLISAVALVVAMVAGTGEASAQARVQLGVRAGITSQDLDLTDVDFVNSTTEEIDHFSTDSRFGFHAAVVSRIRLTALGRGALGLGLFFQPEVIYSQNNYKIQKNGVDEHGNNEPVSKIRMQSVDVPLLLSGKLSIIRVQAGPVINVLYKTSSVKGDIDMTATKRPAVGYSLGVSVDVFGGFVIDGRYNGQFNRLKNHIEDGDTVYEGVRGSLSSWAVGLSWLF